MLRCDSKLPEGVVDLFVLLSGCPSTAKCQFESALDMSLPTLTNSVLDKCVILILIYFIGIIGHWVM